MPKKKKAPEFKSAEILRLQENDILVIHVDEETEDEQARQLIKYMSKTLDNAGLNSVQVVVLLGDVKITVNRKGDVENV